MLELGGFLWAGALRTVRVRQQHPLPIHQLRCVLVPVVRQLGHRATAGDEGGVNSQLGGAGVPTLSQLQEAAFLRLARAPALPAQYVRVVFARNFQPMLGGVGQADAAAFRKMPREERLDWAGGSRSRGDFYQHLMAEDKVGRPVCPDRLRFPPLPQRAQDSESGPAQSMTA